MNLRDHLPAGFPTIVCLCGSTRFADAYRDALCIETLAGRIVLSVGLLGHAEGLDSSGPVKAMLDELHLRKIDLCDEVLILNGSRYHCPRTNTWWDGPGVCPRCARSADAHPLVSRPYIGESTRRELEYARSQGKRVRFLKEVPRGE